MKKKKKKDPKLLLIIDIIVIPKKKKKKNQELEFLRFLYLETQETLTSGKKKRLNFALFLLIFPHSLGNQTENIAKKKKKIKN